MRERNNDIIILHLQLEEAYSHDYITYQNLNDTIISLRVFLSVFLSIRPGDYVLRDPAGGPRGTVRVLIQWKYPFQPSVDTVLVRQGRQDVERSEKEERRKEEAKASQRPIAKPRVKVILFKG